MISTPKNEIADPDDDDRLDQRDEQPHQGVRPDQLPATERGRRQSLEDPLLAVRDQRDGREDADLHDRHREDARHEVADEVQVLGLDGLRAHDDHRRVPTEIDDAEDAPDRLVDRTLELLSRGVGVDLDLDRRPGPRSGRREAGAIPGRDDDHGIGVAGLHRRDGRVATLVGQLDVVGAPRRRLGAAPTRPSRPRRPTRGRGRRRRCPGR